MFNDARSKSVVFVAHCILNQNAISDGTASFPGCMKDIVEVLWSSDVGIIQMPCPELHCLGLDRGDVHGGSFPVVEENTRIRKVLSQHSSTLKIKQLAQHIVFQILEYQKHGFKVKGIVGINRSPSCGVNTTSKDNLEVEGKGIFIDAIVRQLKKHNVDVELVGIKGFEPEKAVSSVNQLLGINL